MKLVQFDISSRETDCWVNLKSHVTCLKLLKYRSKSEAEGRNGLVSESSFSYDGNKGERNKGRLPTTESEILKDTLIAAAFHDFDVVLYDLDLN